MAKFEIEVISKGSLIEETDMFAHVLETCTFKAGPAVLGGYYRSKLPRWRDYFKDIDSTEEQDAAYAEYAADYDEARADRDIWENQIAELLGYNRSEGLLEITMVFGNLFTAVFMRPISEEKEEVEITE